MRRSQKRLSQKEWVPSHKKRGTGVGSGAAVAATPEPGLDPQADVPPEAFVSWLTLTSTTNRG